MIVPKCPIVCHSFIRFTVHGIWCLQMVAETFTNSETEDDKKKKMSCILFLIVLFSFFLNFWRQLLYLATFNVRNVICILNDFELISVFLHCCSKFTCPTVTYSIKYVLWEYLKLQIVYGTKEHEHVNMQLKGDFNNSITRLTASVNFNWRCSTLWKDNLIPRSVFNFVSLENVLRRKRVDNHEFKFAPKQQTSKTMGQLKCVLRVF